MKVISIYQAPGGKALDAPWRTDPKYVYIGRPGKGLAGPYGNPHPVGFPCARCRGLDGKLLVHKRGEAIVAFEETLKKWDRDLLKKKLSKLFDAEFLVCFCAPQACHGDVLVRWINMFKKEEMN